MSCNGANNRGRTSIAASVLRGIVGQVELFGGMPLPYEFSKAIDDVYDDSAKEIRKRNKCSIYEAQIKFYQKQ